jgi:hypothetical protein
MAFADLFMKFQPPGRMLTKRIQEFARAVTKTVAGGGSTRQSGQCVRGFSA